MIPFFLESNPGNRFCVYHPPKGTCRGSVLFVAPFAEELNKSRRMVSMQSSALANKGYAVLAMDLYGCGDSSGDFREARWAIWMEDLELASKWLNEKHGMPIMLWGLRFGALVGMEFARISGEKFGRVLLWQPVLSGEAFVSQFLRLRVTSEMLSGGKTSVQELKGELFSNGSIEIAGYDLPADIAENMGRLKLEDLALPGVMHQWLEISASGELSPASHRVLAHWKSEEIPCEASSVQGEPFWATQEITECRALIEETARLFSN